MPIIRNKTVFTIEVEPFLGNKLSYGARGVLVTLLALPDNTGIEIEDLLAKSPCDESNSMQGYLDELRAIGYLNETDTSTPYLGGGDSNEQEKHFGKSFDNRSTTSPLGYNVEFHRNYLSKGSWKKKRKAIFNRDGYACTSCGSKENLTCHHISYANLGNEPLDDLLTLCRSCHAKHHSSQKAILRA